MALQELKSLLVHSDKVRTIFCTQLRLGFADAVGMAIAQAHTASVYNKPGFEIISTMLALLG